MVVRKRLRTFLQVTALYLVASACVGYFLYQAQYGSRGLDSKANLKVAIDEQKQLLAELSQERHAWQERVDLLSRDGTDRDILEERVREEIGRVHRNDVVVMGR